MEHIKTLEKNQFQLKKQKQTNIKSNKQKTQEKEKRLSGTVFSVKQSRFSDLEFLTKWEITINRLKRKEWAVVKNYLSYKYTCVFR